MRSISFIMPNLAGGGAEKIILNLANNLCNLTSVKIILLKEEGPNLKKVDPRVLVVGLNQELNLKGILKLIYFLRKDDSEIIFSGLGQLNVIVILFKKILKNKIFVARETNVVSLFNMLKKKEKKKIYYILDFLYKKVYKNFDKIIVQSDDMLEDLNKYYGIPLCKMLKINNFINFDSIQKNVNHKELLEGPIKVISMGRLEHQKGFDLLIKQVSKLENLNYKFYIFGKGKEKKNLERLIVEKRIASQIKIRDYVDNPYEYMKEADIFILPSRVEGFPNVLLESLACGTPVLVNDFKGGINEIIKEKLNGQICNFELESINFEKTLNEVLSYRKNRDQIKQDIFQRFNQKDKIKEYIQLLKNI